MKIQHVPFWNKLLKPDGLPLIDNATLAALTLFIATSKTEEAEIV